MSDNPYALVPYRNILKEARKHFWIQRSYDYVNGMVGGSIAAVYEPLMALCAVSCGIPLQNVLSIPQSVFDPLLMIRDSDVKRMEKLRLEFDEKLILFGKGKLIAEELGLK